MMNTYKFNVKCSIKDQAKVFNVIMDAVDSYKSCINYVYEVVKHFAPKYCIVEVNRGCKRHRGKALTIYELSKKLTNLHFYYYTEEEIEYEETIPLAIFYRQPFTPEYNCFIGATFFNNIREAVISELPTALSEIIPYRLYLAKSGSYYCWEHLDYRFLPDGRFQIYRVISKTKKIKVKKEYK